MSTKVVPGVLIATADPEQVAREGALRMAKAIRDAIEARGGAAIALSGGNTPRAAYTRLAHEPGIEWSRVDVFWVDERAVPPGSDRSNYHWAKATLLDAANVPADRVHRMMGEASDLAAAARDYEQLLRARVAAGATGVPSFDLVLLGVGDDGHTASLFPGEPTVNETSRLVAAVPAKGEREARLTLTAPVIEAARSVIVMAEGRSKHEPLERVWSVSGELSETPARIVRNVRGALTWIIDRAAGGLDR